MTDWRSEAAALAAAAPSEHDDTAGAVRRYARWCHDNGEVAFPIVEATALRYLADHPGWAWSYVRTIVHALNRYQKSVGGPRVTGVQTEKYLKALRRTRGSTAGPKSAPIPANELPALVESIYRRAPQPRQWVRPQRAAVAVSMLTRLPLVTASSAGLSVSDVVVRRTPTGMSLSWGNQSRHIRFDDEPDLLSFIAAYEPAPDEPYRLARPSPPAIALLQKRLAAAGATGEAATPQTWASLDRASLLWVLLCCDSHVRETARAVAVLLVGRALGRRHQDLREVRNRDISIVDGDVRILFPRSKTDRRGRGEVRFLMHVADGVRGPLQPCDQLCAACALLDLVEINAVHGFDRDDSLLATRYGGGIAPMTKNRMNQILGAASDDLGLARRYSTRGMRSGLVTEMVAGGATVDELMEATGHRSASEVLRYNFLRDTGGPIAGLDWDG